MPHYLIQATYHPGDWPAMITGEGRALWEPEVQAFGGSLHASYLALGGELQYLAIVEMTDEVNAAALGMLSSSGTFKDLKVVPLMTHEQITKALDLAGSTQAKIAPRAVEEQQ